MGIIAEMSERKESPWFDKFLESALNNFTEHMFYGPAETVGAMRAADAFPDPRFFPGFDLVFLDFEDQEATDDSYLIYRVPKDLIKPGSIVEVIAKRGKGVLQDMALVSIRPFDRRTYGKPFGYKEAQLDEMFAFNVKTRGNSESFFKKFIRNNDSI